jgi:hypothetical protein
MKLDSSSRQLCSHWRAGEKKRASTRMPASIRPSGGAGTWQQQSVFPNC